VPDRGYAFEGFLFGDYPSPFEGPVDGRALRPASVWGRTSATLSASIETTNRYGSWRVQADPATGGIRESKLWYDYPVEARGSTP
jgi:hypothetical protein